jgi:hypothetical protein
MSMQVIRLSALLILSSIAGAECRAADWMFRDSYFHMPSAGLTPQQAMTMSFPWPVPESRGALRTAIAHEAPGIAIRGAWRYNNYRLFNGNSQDTTIFREYRVETSR